MLSVDPTKEAAWENVLHKYFDENNDAFFANKIGSVVDKGELLISQGDANLVKVTISQLRESYENGIPRRILKDVRADND